MVLILDWNGDDAIMNREHINSLGLVIRLIKLGSIQCYWTNIDTNHRAVLPECLKDDQSTISKVRNDPLQREGFYLLADMEQIEAV